MWILIDYFEMHFLQDSIGFDRTVNKKTDSNVFFWIKLRFESAQLVNGEKFSVTGQDLQSTTASSLRFSLNFRRIKKSLFRRFENCNSNRNLNSKCLKKFAATFSRRVWRYQKFTNKSIFRIPAIDQESWDFKPFRTSESEDKKI